MQNQLKIVLVFDCCVIICGDLHSILSTSRIIERKTPAVGCNFMISLKSNYSRSGIIIHNNTLALNFVPCNEEY